jgi:CRP-like cAMP-binding protein
LIEYLPVLKEMARAQLDTLAKGAAVLHRYKKGEIVCEEGDFGSTAFFIVSGRVDIFIHNPVSHLRTRPTIGIFGRSMARMKSFLTDDKSSPRPERGAHQFIGIDANVDLPINRPLAQLGPGELFGEMTCRMYQPRSATVRAREPCVMIEMLRVILGMLVGNRQVSDLTKRVCGSRRTRKANLLKLSWTKDIVKRVEPHRFFGGAIEAQTMLFKAGEWLPVRSTAHLHANMRDAQLEQSNSPRSATRESSIQHG